MQTHHDKNRTMVARQQQQQQQQQVAGPRKVKVQEAAGTAVKPSSANRMLRIPDNKRLEGPIGLLIG